MEMDFDEIVAWGAALSVLGIILCALLLVIMKFTGLHINTGEGNHIGIITASEKTGLIFKTKKAYFKTSVESTQEDEYCVKNNKIYEKLKKLSTNQSWVKISYKSYFITGFFECDNENAIITDVQVLTTKQKKGE